jgi:hypothetical protein
VFLLAALRRLKTNTAVTTFDSPQPAKKGNSGRLADLFYGKESSSSIQNAHNRAINGHWQTVRNFAKLFQATAVSFELFLVTSKKSLHVLW